MTGVDGFQDFISKQVWDDDAVPLQNEAVVQHQIASEVPVVPELCRTLLSMFRPTLVDCRFQEVVSRVLLAAVANTLQVDWGFDPADEADVRLHLMLGTLWDANPGECVGDWHLRPWLVHDLNVKLQASQKHTLQARWSFCNVLLKYLFEGAVVALHHCVSSHQVVFKLLQPVLDRQALSLDV